MTIYESGTHDILGYDELRTDFAYRSKRNAQLHFGLGLRNNVDVDVKMSDGSHATWNGLTADETYTFKFVNIDIKPGNYLVPKIIFYTNLSVPGRIHFPVLDIHA